jgi:pyruvate ferredoxin oxidoreductase alpha subunit
MKTTGVLRRVVLTGNEAVAHGARLSRPKVIAAYPITPQTVIVETLAEFIAKGMLSAEYVESEGEHGALATVIGAALTGVRTFTATCSQGFAFAYENIAWIPGMRLPVVMAVVNRTLSMPLDIGCEHSDSMTARDLGWVQLYVESNQEALDTVIQAYRIAEDQRVLLPVMVCMDAFAVSHTTEVVEIPDQKSVDTFLPLYEQKHIILDPESPMEIVSGPSAESGMAYEWLKNEALMEAGGVIKEANEEFNRRFGRSYGNGLVEKIDCEDAEVVLVTMGSISGNAKSALKELRKEGKRVGLVKLRCFRPFPRKELLELADKVSVIAVLDRNLSKGLGEGACVTEVKSVLYNLKIRPKVIGFTVGLHGMETSVSDIKYIANKALVVARTQKPAEENEFVPNIRAIVKSINPTKKDKLYYPGTISCPGCSMSLQFRHTMDCLGENVVLLRTAGCQAWASAEPGTTVVGVPFGRSTLPAGCAAATGVSLGLKAKGYGKVQVVLFGGDGSVGDMGFGALSGAAERNENFMCVVYDNEAYANTGIQRSGTTPQFAWTTTTPVGIEGRGKRVLGKDLPLIVAAHRVPYVATASVAYIEDLRRKIAKAKAIQGFRYIHIYSPCPTSWRFPTDKVIEVARLGVQTGIHSIYEIEGGRLKITVKPQKLKPVEDYLRLQGRFSHLSDAEIKAIQQNANKSREQLSWWGGVRSASKFDSRLQPKAKDEESSQ